jgi:hypothetical protein
MHPDLAKLARRQGGAFSRAQALRFHSERTVDRRLHDGEWCVVMPGVYRAASTPETQLMTVHAAVLYAGRGARASHFTAASVFTIDADPVDDIWVTIPHDRRVEERPGLRVMRSRQLSGAHVTTRRGLPTTSATRTVVDLAEKMARPAIDAVLADAIRHNLVSLDYLRRLEARLATRRGAHPLRAVLADFDPALESILEREYAEILTAAGLPVGKPQHEIFDGKLLVARVDFAYVDLQLAVEVDGYHYHSRSEQLDRDRRRERALARHKWNVIRFTTSDIRGQPAAVVADLADQLCARAA